MTLPTDNEAPKELPTQALETPSDTPSPTRAGGRPGVSQTEAIEAIETWIARTGKSPSIRELRSALGGTGSMSTLSRYLREHAAERLLAGEDPATGTAEDIVAKALNAALALLAAETAHAADENIATCVREADARIAAADGVKQRALDKAQTLTEERERALGELSSLKVQVDAQAADITRVRTQRDDALSRETAGKADYAALDAAFGQLQTQRDQLEADQQHDRNALVQLRTQVLSQTERISKLESLCTQHEAERDSARALHSREQESLAEAQQRLATVSEELQQARQHAATQQAEQQRAIEAFNIQVSALDTARQQAESQAQTALAERNALQARESMFEDLKATLAQWSQVPGEDDKSESSSTSDDQAST